MWWISCWISMWWITCWILMWWWPPTVSSLTILLSVEKSVNFINYADSPSVLGAWDNASSINSRRRDISLDNPGKGFLDSQSNSEKEYFYPSGKLKLKGGGYAGEKIRFSRDIPFKKTNGINFYKNVFSDSSRSSVTSRDTKDHSYNFSLDDNNNFILKDLGPFLFLKDVPPNGQTPYISSPNLPPQSIIFPFKSSRSEAASQNFDPQIFENYEKLSNEIIQSGDGALGAVYNTVGIGGSAMRPVGQVHQKFATEPGPQTAVVGSTAVLPCRVTGKAGHLQWTKDGFGMGTDRNLFGFSRYSMIGDDDEGDFSLRIQPVSLEDDAYFQCQVSAIDGIPGIRSLPVRLTVFVPPAPPVVTPKVLQTTAGKKETLLCESIGGRPAPEIQWLDDSRRESIQMGFVVTSNLMEDGKRSVVKSSLTFTSERRHDNQTITCSSSNQALASPLTSSILLQVSFAPEVSLESQPKTLIEGDDVTFLCDSLANPATVTYRWFINGRRIPNKTSKTLALEKISRTLHKNRVACDVTNEVGTSKKTHNIEVHYGPTFQSLPRDVMAEKGEEATLKCKVDSNPPSSVVWLKKGSGKIIGSGSSLTIKVEESNAGVYRCIANVRAPNFNFPELVGHLRLLLKGPPRIISASEQWGPVGGPASLTCSAISVPSPIRVTWEFRGREIDKNDPRFDIVEEERKEHLKNILVIYSTELTDFGPYNCSVINEYGTVRQLITLHPEKGIPILVIIGSVVFILIVTVIVVSVVFCNKRPKLKENPDEKDYNSVSNLYRGNAESKLIEKNVGLPLLSEPSDEPSPLQDSPQSVSYKQIGEDSPYHQTVPEHQYRQIMGSEKYNKSQSQPDVRYELNQRREMVSPALNSPAKTYRPPPDYYCTMKKDQFSQGILRNPISFPQRNVALANGSANKCPSYYERTDEHWHTPTRLKPSNASVSWATDRVDSLSDDPRTPNRYLNNSRYLNDSNTTPTRYLNDISSNTSRYFNTSTNSSRYLSERSTISRYPEKHTTSSRYLDGTSRSNRYLNDTAEVGSRYLNDNTSRKYFSDINKANGRQFDNNRQNVRYFSNTVNKSVNSKVVFAPGSKLVSDSDFV